MNHAVSGTDTQEVRLIPRIVAGLGAAACFAMLVAMLVSHRTGGIQQQTSLEVTSAADAVKFANPFDHKEVFEFPAGTSTEEAQKRVADILLQRAQERSRR